MFTTYIYFKGIEDNKMWLSYSKTKLPVKSTKRDDAEEYEVEIKSESSNEEEVEKYVNMISLSLQDFQLLAVIINYLRTKYKYCLWCGIKYESLEDIEDNCPGNTYDSH